jgi:YegS/Rv2252/BmrU family lipid kinase
MPDHRPLVIVNPKAGGGFSERKSARMIGALSEGLGEIEVTFTAGPLHATELARQAAEADRPLVVAFGGDGTISEVAGGLLAARAAGHDRTELGIIPRGTGGDFRRTIELPRDVAEAARHIRDRPARLIDAGRATFTTPQGETASRYFVNMASFGFSSAVAARANSSSKTLGPKVAFIGATVRTLVSHQNTEVFLEIDGAPAVRRTLMLGAAGNGRFFGGGMKICPDAKLDSGELSFVIVGDFGPFRVLGNLHRLFAGTHVSLDDVSAVSARRIRATPVDGDQVIPLEMDGETPGRLPATIEVLPRALPLRF